MLFLQPRRAASLPKAIYAGLNGGRSAPTIKKQKKKQKKTKKKKKKKKQKKKQNKTNPGACHRKPPPNGRKLRLGAGTLPHRVSRFIR